MDWWIIVFWATGTPWAAKLDCLEIHEKAILQLY